MVADENSRSDFQSPISIADAELDSGQSPHSPFEASCCGPLAQASVADQSKDDGGSDTIACANYEGSERSNRPCGEGEYGRVRDSRENMERWYRDQNGSNRRTEIAKKWHYALLNKVLECRVFRQEATSACTIPWLPMRLVLVVSGLSALQEPGCASGGELKWACANDDGGAEQQRIQTMRGTLVTLYMASNHRHMVTTTSSQVLIVFVCAHKSLGNQAMQGRDVGTLARSARPADRGLRICRHHVGRHSNRDWTAMLSYITLIVHILVCVL